MFRITSLAPNSGQQTAGITEGGAVLLAAEPSRCGGASVH